MRNDKTEEPEQSQLPLSIIGSAADFESEDESSNLSGASIIL